MLLLTLMCLIMSFSLSIMLTPSPLLLGVWILITALLISIFLATITYSWVGFLIFLIYVGGMLVMFAYFTAIQPNQFMQANSLLVTLALTFSLFFIIMFPLTPSLVSNLNLAPSYSILSLYASPNIPVLMFLGIMLFLALVAVVKVSKSLLGPLRPFNYV